MSFFYLKMQKNKKKTNKSLNSFKNPSKSLIKFLLKRKAKTKNKCILIQKFFPIFSKEGKLKKWLLLWAKHPPIKILVFQISKVKYLALNYLWKITFVRKKHLSRKFKFLKNSETSFEFEDKNFYSYRISSQNLETQSNL